MRTFLFIVSSLLSTATLWAGTVTWTGGGGDNSWHNPANWSGALVPTAGDDVIINVSGTSVEFSAGTSTVASVTCSRPFTISGGALNVTNGFNFNSTPFSLTGGILDVRGISALNNVIATLRGGILTSVLNLNNGVLIFGTNATTSGVLAARGTCTMSGDIPSTMTLWVQGNSSFGNPATMAVTNSVANRGVIQLEAVTSGYTSQISVSAGSILTNDINGMIRASLGANGPASILGDLENSGTVLVETNVTLSGSLSASRFTQKAGLIQVDGTFSPGRFLMQGGLVQANGQLITLSGGTFDFQGGQVQGLVRAYNSFVSVANSVSLASTIRVVGASGILSSNGSSAVTLWIEGNSNYGNPAALTVTNTTVNRGTIKLESTTTGYSSQLAASAGAALVNAAGGTIRANLGANGPASLLGDMENSGTFLVETNVTLSANVAASRFTQKAGLIQVDGTFTPGHFEMQGGLVQANGQFTTLSSGSFDFQGGKLQGFVRAQNAYISIAGTVSQASTLRAVGPLGILASNGSPAVTVWIEGNSGYANPALLTVTNTTVNRGTIQLEPSTTGYSSQLLVGPGAVLLNTTNGTIRANLGASGNTSLSGEVENSGTMWASSNSTFTVSGNLRHINGVLRGDGTFVKQNGNFEFNGGRIEGTVLANNCLVAVAGNVTEASTLSVVGVFGVLASNGSPSVKLWIQGTPTYGNPGRLTITNHTINRGTIQLESGNLSFGSELTVNSGVTLTNLSEGVIVANEGATGPRSITGDVENWGTMLAGSNATFTISGNLRQMQGVLRGDGTFFKQAGNFEFNGGRLEGTVRANNCFVAVAGTVTEASTLSVVGLSGILASNGAPPVTLWIEGNPTYGNPGRLTATNDTVNRGTLLLDVTTPGGYSSELTANAGTTFVNASNGIIRANLGPGGTRSLNGRVTNQGLMILNDAILNLQGGPFINDISGLISGSGTFNASSINFTNQGTVSPGASPGILSFNGSYIQSPAGQLNIEINGMTAGTNYDRLAINGNATLDGTMNVAVLDPFVPAVSNSFRVLTFNSRNGDFATYNGLHVSTNIALQANYSSTALDLVAYQNTNQIKDPPYITVQPASQTIINGQTANFSVTAAGTSPFSYFWRFNGSNIPAATLSTLTLVNAQTNQSGNYQVVITNFASGVTSAVAVLTVRPVADLVIKDIAAPTNVFAGQPVMLSWRSLNQGSQTAIAPWAESVGLATNSAGAAEIPIASFVFQDTLSAGQSVIRTQAINVPAGMDGQLFWIFHTDTGNQVAEELNETNNTTVSATPVRLRAPDLQPLSITAPSLALLGQTVGVSWITTNAGSGPVSGLFNDRVYLNSSSNTLASALPLTLAAATNVPVAGLGLITNNASVSLPLSPDWPAGNYFLLVTVDYGNAIAEFAETNNLISVPITLSQPPLPDLAVTNIIAPTNALPGQTVTVSWVVTNATALSVNSGWSETIYLSTNSTGDGAIELATFDFTNTLASGGFLSRTQAVVIPESGPVGNLWFAVLADSRNEIFEAYETNNLGVAVVATVIPAMLSLDLNSTQISEGATQPLQPVVTRNGSTAQPLTVTLTNGDTTELSMPASVVIPAGQSSATFNVFALSDGIVDGPQTVTMTAGAPGFAAASAIVTVLDTNVPRLTVSLATNAVIEGQTLAAIVTRDGGTNSPVTVVMSSSNPSHLLTPLPLTIAAGQLSANFSLLAVDDLLVETQTVYTVSAAADGYTGGSTNVTVIDNDLPQVVLTFAASSVSEADGPLATIGTVTRSPASQSALSLDLESDTPGSLLVPSQIVIPPGASSASFPVAAVDNNLVDGTRSITVRVYINSGNFGNRVGQGTPASITVTDDDGPALQLALAKNVVPENTDPATTATVTRNTGTNTSLLVTLSSSDTNAATVPVTVTIPQGLSMVNFNVTTPAHTNNDGNRVVTLTAIATNFASSSANLTVSDLNLPDLVISTLTAPSTGDADTYASLGYTIKNQGLGAMVSNNIIQRIWFSSDPVVGGDTLVAEQTFSGGLPPGQQFGQNISVKLPQQAGDYWVIIETDSDNAVPEIRDDNNIRISSLPIHVTAPYDAEVSTTLPSAPSGTSVPLVGHAFKPGNVPAPSVLVNIHLNVRGTHRVISAFTDAQGNFSLNWQPLPGEAGFYQIGAAHPGATNAVTQDTFTLYGIDATPPSPTIQMADQSSVTGAVAIINPGDVPLTSLTAQVVSNSVNLNVSLALETNILAGLATNQLSFTITALNSSLPQGYVMVHLASAEGATRDVLFLVNIVQLTARLVALPSELNQGVKRGVQSMVAFQIGNVGGATSGPITISLPPVPWINLASANPLPSLAPGETNVVTLQLMPPPGVALGVYNGSIAFNSAGTGLSVPFAFRALSEAKGDLLVNAVDEFTFYAAGAPRVTNAAVILKDHDSGTILTNGFTDANGQFFVPQLVEGYYDVEVSAPKHTTDRGTYLVTAGITNEAKSFLSLETLRYTWTVVPTEIQDRYKIVIETQFETVVPIPVVTVEPSVIDLANFPIGDTQVNLKVCNHGLIAAKDFRLDFDQHPCVVFKPLVNRLDAIAAMSCVEIPLTIRRVPGCTNIPPPDPNNPNNPGGGGGGGSGSGGSGPCIAYGRTTHIFPCESRTNVYVTPIVFPNAADCKGFDYTFYHWPGGGPAGGLTYASSGGGGNGFGATGIPVINTNYGGHVGATAGYYSTPPPPPDRKNPCNTNDVSPVAPPPPCLLPAIIGNCLPIPPIIGCPLGLAGCYKGLQGGINAKSIGDCGEAAATCLGKTIPFLKVPKCIGKVLSCLNNSMPQTASPQSLAQAQAFTSDPIVAFWPGMRAQFDTFNDLTGAPDGVWLNDLSSSNTTAWFTQFSESTSASSDGERYITDAERAVLLADPQPEGVLPAEVARVLDRWNRSQSNWDQGIFRPQDAPPGANLDFIDVYAWLDHVTSAGTYQDLAESAGFTSPIDAVIQTARTLAIADQGGGICAGVKLRLDQEAVLAREAFRATLEFENGESSPLTGVAVALTVSDTSGNDVSTLFGIPAPDLSNLTNITGLGVLASGISASVGWTIIPTSDAAPTGPVRYMVSGVLAYTLNGISITVPLAPAGITVNPTARLEVKYFHERDVFSDDPFTDIVEPTVPFSLAVMVQNKGAGAAHNFQITSAQPKIIDNEKGLLIDFKIIGTEVNGQSLTPSLTANFGNIPGGTNVIGRWLMTSTLQGLFTDYNAKFEHVDDLGNSKLSLIDQVSIHELIHVAQAGGPFEDGRPDFLVNDFPDLNDYPDRLYMSDGSTNRVLDIPFGTVTGTLSPGNLQVQLSASLPGGWVYVVVPDPGNGAYRLASVTRSDNVVIPLNTNVWVTDRTFIGLGREPIRENVLHLLDYNSTGVYTLTYAPNPTPDATPPLSAISALPAESSTGIPLFWSGTDNVGIAGFDIYVSENGGSFTRWLANASTTSSIYHGNFGSTYAFYSVAVDQAGNREAAPATPDAQTTITHTNHAPVFAAITNRTMVEGDTLSLSLDVSDPDGDNLSLSLGAGTPAGALLNSQDRSLTWVTGEAHGPSTNTITIIARDSGIPQLTASQAFTVIVLESNSPPSLDQITNRTITEGQLLSFAVSPSDPDLPPQTLAFSLAGAPAGATINPTTGIFSWQPTDTQGGTTNTISVIVTDNGSPALSATQTFSVIVLDTQPDFVLSIGSTQLLSGASATVPFMLKSGLDLTNVQWVLAINTDRLTNLALQNISGQVGTADLLPLGSNRYFARFASRPNSVLQGQLQLANLSFDTVSNDHSSVAQLGVDSLAGSRASTSSPLNVAGGSGRVFIVGTEPILDARRATGALMFSLYGIPGSSFQLTYVTNLIDTNRIVAFRTPQTNIVQDLSVPLTLPRAFYRAENFAPDPPVLELQGVTGTNVPLLVYGRRGSNYILEASSDLSGGGGWTPITNATSSNAFNFFGPDRGSNNVKLFRVRRP